MKKKLLLRITLYLLDSKIFKVIFYLFIFSFCFFLLDFFHIFDLLIFLADNIIENLENESQNVTF